MRLDEHTIIADRYEVLESIGSGGMAIVYKARDRKLGRFVTIKVLREEFTKDENFIMRFRTEAQSSARLSHPNIVNVYDVGDSNDIHYIVMEYIEGETLKELIKRSAPFNETAILNIAGQIASGIQHAHKNNIVHRDIKPQNILITKDMAVKVTDFGIARAVSSATTSVSANAVGSVHYFSPEQARGGYVDEKSDIYSLGIVLFEMATGKLPHDGDTSVSVALKHINEEIPYVRELNPDISPNLEKIIRKSTSKQLRYRYASMDELIEDIRKTQFGEIVEIDEDVSSHEDAHSPTVALTKNELKEIKENNHRKSKKPIRQTRRIDEFKEDDMLKKQETKIIIAAAFAALLVIAVVVFTGYKLLGSSGKVTVPDFKALSIEAAEELAKNSNLKLISENGTSADVELGFIYDQKETAGSSVKKGSTITVYLSTGAATITVPDLVNKLESIAQKELENLKLNVKVIREYNDKITTGVVINQKPKANDEIKEGELVTIYVSKGTDGETISMPNFIGLSEKDSIKAIEDAGLVVGSRSYRTSTAYGEGIVIDQNIPAGDDVAKGSTIYLTVSTAFVTTTTESTSEETTESTSETSETQSTSEVLPLSD